MGLDFFYQNLSQSGYDMGPSFQRTYNAALGKDPQATGDIQVFQLPKPECPQAHIVHPITLDALLQMLIRVLIGRWLQKRSDHGAEFEYTVLDNARRSVLTQVKGLKLAVIAGSASNDTDDVDQEWPDCFHVEYKPNMYILQTGQGFTGVPDAEPSFNDCLGALAHKTPGLRVLEAGAGTWPVVQRPSLGDLRKRLDIRFVSYHYTSISSSTIEFIRTQLPRHSPTTFGLSDIQMVLWSKDSKPEPHFKAFQARFLALLGPPGKTANKSAEWRGVSAGKNGLAVLRASGTPIDSEQPRQEKGIVLINEPALDRQARFAD
ncbi:MAG: hypothetical protein Q9206_005083 [Seirophora lacunosa]